MAKYRRQGEPCEAVQWFKMGDHPEVKSSAAGYDFPDGAKVVVDGQECGYLGSTIVRPGDWIVDISQRYVDGRFTVVRQDEFARDWRLDGEEQ